jgi:carboxypeptidase Taq
MNTFELLVSELKHIHALSEIGSLLEWDEQVNLPEASVDFRARQASALATVMHRESTKQQIGIWLEELENQKDLNDDQIVVIREARKNYQKSTKIPEEFVASKAAHLSRSYHAWVEARKKDDFSIFAPYLKQNILYAKEEAGFLGYSKNPYDYWIDCFDPGIDSKTIDAVFDELEKELVPLVNEIQNSPIKADVSFLKSFPIEKQEVFLKEVTSKLGFDYTRGRIDKSVHPFCSGCAFDTRMTTRFFEDNPLDSLFSSIHETGHGLYEQGLPLDHIGTALGQAAGMAAHESQSRLWENQIARSREFWQYWEPTFRETFPNQLQEVSSKDLYLAINSVALNPIRVDSDEVTYNLHIILRFKIERMLFDGSISIDELPHEWNRLSKIIVGIDPQNDAQGVLQDVHWSGAAFGYFPSYTLGNLLAAQLWYTILKELPSTLEDIKKGNFSQILEWLRANVHQYGRRLNALSLAEKVTGEKLNHKCLIKYLKERYCPLYLH